MSNNQEMGISIDFTRTNKVNIEDQKTGENHKLKSYFDNWRSWGWTIGENENEVAFTWHTNMRIKEKESNPINSLNN